MDVKIPTGFNPRTRTGCDRRIFLEPVHAFCFNPRTRMGCDLIFAPLLNVTTVSIHAPARGATGEAEIDNLVREFQSTHPHGVRPTIFKYNIWIIRFQSTHPHGVRHIILPLWRRCCRFNPRTRTGCDFPFFFAVVNNQSFNPRTRTGCDQAAIEDYLAALISIHAPARGATVKRNDYQIPRGFQSTHPHGVRRSFSLVCKIIQNCFNPRTRTGCDLCRKHSLKLEQCFNPRTRTGCDYVHREHCNPPAVSIHAPARGATCVKASIMTGDNSFNPRTRTGCDTKKPLSDGHPTSFQSTHPHGVRQANRYR